jgi:S1-C subfamily serine protease
MPDGVRPVQVALGALGGAAAAVVVIAAGIGSSSRTTTVFQQAPVEAATTTALHAQGLTPGGIYRQDAPGVVKVVATIVQQVPTPFSLSRRASRQSYSTGSGFEVDAGGDILTNWHVVAGAAKVTAQLADNQIVTAQVIGRDPSDDLVLLRIPTDGVRLYPLPLGDSSTAQVGDATFAIGNPFGLDRTLTAGLVSALQRQITAPNGFQIDNVIQTDTPINIGNSGGPLIDAAGRVIGINSQLAMSEGGGFVGVGFAVPINTAKRELPLLEEGGTLREAYLGVTARTIDRSLVSLGLPVARGALVQSVQVGSPAARAGIRAGASDAVVGGQDVVVGGDIILAVDDRPIANADDLANAITARKPGEKVELGLDREGHRLSVTIRLTARPSAVAR